MAGQKPPPSKLHKNTSARDASNLLANKAAREEAAKRTASQALSDRERSTSPPARDPQPGQSETPAEEETFLDALPDAAELAAEIKQLAQQYALQSAQIAKLELGQIALEAKCDGLGTEATAAKARAEAAEQEVQTLTAKLAEAKAAAAQTERRQEAMDRTSRKGNLMFFGVPEVPGTPTAELVKEHLRAVGSPAASKVASASRFGPPPRDRAVGAQTAGTASPIRVTFVSADDTFQVFKASRALREQRHVNVDRDLTVTQKATRGALLEPYKRLRENGFTAFWRSEKLFYTEGPRSPAREFREGDRLPGLNPHAAPRSPARSPGSRGRTRA